MNSTDRIEKQVVLRATRERVWRAISDEKEFGVWFGVEFGAPFRAGSIVPARIVPTKVDPDVAASQEAHAGTPFEIKVERIEPESLFAFRWHPYEPESGADFDSAPSTLVEMSLADHPEGTLLTIVESGFDGIPLEKRAEAFASNEQGWTIQAMLIDKYLARVA